MAGLLVYGVLRFAQDKVDYACGLITAFARASLGVAIIAVVVPRDNVALVAACLTIAALVTASLLARFVPRDEPRAR